MLGGGAITFDFHNTLVHCDAWFDLEVRSLVSAFLRWDGERRGSAVSADALAAADAAYRRLWHAIVEHGIEAPAERCVALVLAELGLAADAGAIAAGVEEGMRGTLDGAEATPGAVETVRALRAAGVPLGVVSSAVYHPFLEWSLTRIGIRDAFAEITTSASAGFYKSRPEIYLHAVERFGLEPAAVVHVGDSLRWDVGGAQRAGLRAVWITGDATANPDSPDGLRPDLTLTSLTDAATPLLKLLRNPPA
ncbi:MAG: HAD family hydrolase [Chloroflexia bacterium]|nr:HAD family hydrolase [Chloroflexia bacterium]